MKILHISHSDLNGGAARAAYRIHHALRSSGVDSTMWVNQAFAGDWTVEEPATRLSKSFASARPHIVHLLARILRSHNTNIQSPAIFPSQWVSRINQSQADVVHLHWVAGEMLSIADIGRIEKPVVWTLHDMWAFCGAEHYTQDSRWREGYRSDNRPSFEPGFDLNRWTWERKRKHWQRQMHIVTPSHWLGDCARQSALMCEWPVSVIPNCLDIERWQPIHQTLARELLGMPADVPLLLFGAMGGARDPRKGFDLLTVALQHLHDVIPGLEIFVFGQLAPRNTPDLGFPLHYTGHLHDDLSLCALYSAADVLVVPSRQDNLPNTVVEAQACGTPVVAFCTGGLPDIVADRVTGALAEPFDPLSLAAAIRWVLEDPQRRKQLGAAARSRAEELLAPERVSRMYEELYRSALQQHDRPNSAQP